MDKTKSITIKNIVKIINLFEINPKKLFKNLFPKNIINELISPQIKKYLMRIYFPILSLYEV